MSETNASIKCCSINICGMSKRSKHMLEKYSSDEGFDLIFVQESESDNQEKLNLCNRKVLTDTNNAQNHGVTIYTHINHTCTLIPEISQLSKNIDSVWGLAVIKSKRYLVGSVYVKHHYPEGISEVINMLNVANQMSTNLKACGVFLQGDFNARHLAWGDKCNDTYGNELVKFLDQNVFTVVAPDSPTFLCKNGHSKIDFAIVTKTLASQVQSCYTDDEVELFSGAPLRGHVPVITVIRSPGGTNNKTIINEKINIESIKWALWSDDLETQLVDDRVLVESYEEPHGLWNYIEKTIDKITTKHSKKKKSTIHSKPFWTEKLTLLCNEMRKARKAFQKRNTDPNLENFISAKEKFDEERKNECEKFILEKTKDLNKSETKKFWKEFNKIFKKKSDGRIDPLKDGKGGFITNTDELEERMFSTFFQCQHMVDQDFDDFFYAKVNQLYTEIKVKPIENENEDLRELNSFVSLNEIKKAIKKTDPNKKSTDNHQMHPKMLHQFGPEALKVIQKLFNMCLNTGQWPWKDALVIFLKKGGKKSYSVPGSYRPISISSYIGKLLEKILASRLIKFLIMRGYHDPDQEGFTLGRNTIRYLNRLDLQIKSDIIDSKTIIGLFIDFEKAFDSVWKRGLIVKLQKIGIHGKSLALIDNFLATRTVQLNINGTNGEIHECEEYGLPQGSALSPILFKIYIMDIIEDLKEKEEVELYKFADDGTIKISCESTNLCTSTLNEVIKSLEQWTRMWRMVINCDRDKTEFICFNKAAREDVIPNSIIITGKPVIQVEQTKVLGLIIDSKLTYKQHSQEIYRRLLEKWAKICSYCNIHWGFNQRVLRRLINTVFIPIIQYAGHIWINTKNMEEINKIWYKLVKSAIGAVFNVKTTICEVILGIPPISVQTDINRIKHLLKLKMNPNPIDKYKDFINKCCNGTVSAPREVRTGMKDTFKFLKWKAVQSPSHFSQQDIDIIENQDISKCMELSSKSCYYSKTLIKKYIELIWYERLKNQCHVDGEVHVPKPSCQNLPIPINTSRQDEVLIMGMMYPQNLMNSFVYKKTYCTESPLCPRCLIAEQTPYHVLTVCNEFHHAINDLMMQLLGEEEASCEDCVTILNCSRSPKFIQYCLDVIKNGRFRNSIELGHIPQ